MPLRGLLCEKLFIRLGCSVIAFFPISSHFETALNLTRKLGHKHMPHRSVYYAHQDHSHCIAMQQGGGGGGVGVGVGGTQGTRSSVAVWSNSQF